jgi:hypothetical protein
VSHNELSALLAVITALRVFLPDLFTGVRSLLRIGVRIGVAELRHTQQAAGGTTTTVAPRDTEV